MRGCCLVALVAFGGPRVTGWLIWLFTNWFDRAYSTWYWPLLGWLLMPWTTLAYMWLRLADVPLLWVIVAIAVFADIDAWESASKQT